MPAPPSSSSSSTRRPEPGAPSSSRAPPPGAPASSNPTGPAGSRSAKGSGPPPAPSSGARSRAPSGASGPANEGLVVGPRARSQSNVGAKLLKKRQSIAYSQHPALFATADGAEAPAVPSLPQGIASSGGTSTGSRSNGPPRLGGAAGPPSTTRAGEPRGQSEAAPSRQPSARSAPPPVVRTEAEKQLLASGLDVDQLASDAFKPEDFLKQNLPSSRANGDVQMADLRKFKAELDTATKVTETGLQRSVFDNYSDFIVISKEIATLESEMLELKGVLEEWRAVPDLLESGTGEDEFVLGSASTPNRRGQRNSIADLATLHKSQLSALWENVEGSQKVVPYVPGRHIITEAGSFVELHAATYKPKHAVHLFLLNDAMLVSQKKHRGAGIGGPSRLVAERCFTLSEIVVVDLKDAGDLQNAIKVKRGKETIIYRTDKPENKKMLLLAFKKVAEELINRKRKEMLNEAEARKGDPSSLRGYRSDFNSSLADTDFDPVTALGLGDSSSLRDLAWIGDFSDELAVAISTRDFETAVALVERGKSILPQISAHSQISHLFRTKLDDRTEDLVTVLLNDLANPAVRKSGVVRTTNWLLRLGLGERAREAFLSARGTLVKRRTRQIKFEGDISMYISELAIVTFTMIKNTCEWYMAAFQDNSMASGFVRWASEQVELYAETFRRQVYGVDQDGRVVEESLEMTKAHGAMLRDVGLDFTFLFDSLLRPDRPKASQRKSSSRLQEASASQPAGSSNLGIPGGRRGGDSLGPPASAVAIARKSIYMLHSPNPDSASRSASQQGRPDDSERQAAASPDRQREAESAQIATAL
ncbi:hypothetical protein BMF94_4368 [Rhodotorula taiwanensis]|uniref:Exocyst complex component EXO84 n=1 Tax=Rhodotorula taiwanensis TaxID=741276 RepID=A0A2S5B6Y4_9BASI|nr:hypothetical protein BMF94_4368 [Rhodotorula taiwanensis]